MDRLGDVCSDTYVYRLSAVLLYMVHHHRSVIRTAEIALGIDFVEPGDAGGCLTDGLNKAAVAPGSRDFPIILKSICQAVSLCSSAKDVKYPFFQIL